jgi:hypothetical protein
VIFRKSVAEIFNYYDITDQTKHTEDYDLWLKLGTKGKFANLPIYGIRYTIHPNQLSAKYKHKQFLSTMISSHKFRHFYPNYLLGQVRNLARLIWYGYIYRYEI